MAKPQSTPDFLADFEAQYNAPKQGTPDFLADFEAQYKAPQVAPTIKAPVIPDNFIEQAKQNPMVKDIEKGVGDQAKMLWADAKIGALGLSMVPDQNAFAEISNYQEALKAKYGNDVSKFPADKRAEYLQNEQDMAKRLQNIAESSKKIQDIQSGDIRKSTKEYFNLSNNKAYQDADLWGKTKMAAKIIAKDPVGIITDLGVQSAPQSLAMVATALLARVGLGRSTMAPAAGLSSATMEFGNEYANLRQQGMPHDEAWLKAGEKSAVIGLFDAASFASAGHAANKVFTDLNKSAAKEAIKDVAKETGKQATYGGAGEALGSYVSGQEIDPSAVMAEAVGEVAGAPLEGYVGFNEKLAEKAQAQAEQPPAAPVETPAPVPVAEVPPPVSPVAQGLPTLPQATTSPVITPAEVETPEVLATTPAAPVEAAPQAAPAAPPLETLAEPGSPRAQMEETLAKLKEDQAALKEKIAGRESLVEKTQAQINRERQQAKKAAKSDSLVAHLKRLGGINSDDKLDITGEGRRMIGGGYNPVFKKGATSLMARIEDGQLDDYLPYELRRQTHEQISDQAYDATEAYNYIADVISRAENPRPYHIEEAAAQKAMADEEEARAAEEQAKAEAEAKAMEEANAKLAEAGQEERQAAAEAKVYEEPQPALELTGETEAEIKATEKAQAQAKAEEAKKAAAPAPEEFALTGSKREADLAAAQGAQDLFAQPAKPKAKLISEDNIEIKSPVYLGLHENNFNMLAMDDPRTYKDNAGDSHRTFEKNGVRIALDGDQVLFTNDRGHVMKGRGEDKETTVAFIGVDKDMRGKGAAKEALKTLADIADKSNVDLYVQPSQLDKTGLNREQLIALYKQFGFEDASYYDREEGTKKTDRILVRKPHAKSEAPKSQAEINKERQAAKREKAAPKKTAVQELADNFAPTESKKISDIKGVMYTSGAPMQSGWSVVTGDGSVSLIAKVDPNDTEYTVHVWKYDPKSKADQLRADAQARMWADLNEIKPVAKEKAKPKFNKQKILDDLIEHEYAFETKAQLKAYAKKLIKQGYYTEEQLAGHDYLFKDRDMGVEDIFPDIEQEVADNLDKLERGESIKQIKLQNIEPEVKTNTPAFKRWFGASKIVDANGKPKVMYHGTKGDFSAFRMTTSGMLFVTEDPGFAEIFATPEDKTLEENEGGNILPVYVRAVKPFDYENPSHVAELHKELQKNPNTKGITQDGIALGRWEILEDRDVVNTIKRLGFDGMYVYELELKNLAVFSPNQIKSAVGNIGTFDTSTSILSNLGTVERTDKQMAEQSEIDREEIIQEYKVARAAGRRALKKVAAEGSNLRMQKELNELLAHEERLKDYLDLTKPNNNRAVDFMLRATQALQKGDLDPDVEEVIRSIYEANPSILEGLKLSIRSRKDEGRDSGNFNAFTRVVTLWKDGTGVDNPKTIRHELMHSLEQLMTPQAKQNLVEAWYKALQKAMKANQDEPHRKYFEAIMKFLDDPSQETLEAAIKLVPSYDMYQYINPSEYWAVNGERLFGEKLGTPWNRFVQGIKRLFEGLKKVLGFNNDYAIHKAFNDVIQNKEPRNTTEMIVDYLTQGKFKTTFLENIREDDDLMEELGVAEVPNNDDKTMKELLVMGFEKAAETAKELFNDPANKMARSLSSAADKLTEARIQAIDYSAGLIKKDLEVAKGKIRYANGLYTAAIAVKNALHSAQIAARVLLDGGLEYNNEYGQFMAVEKEHSMKNIIVLQHELRNKLGTKLADKIINAYLAAKRTRSIQNEFLTRQAMLEFAKENVAATEGGERVTAMQELEEAQKAYDDVLRAYKQIPAFLLYKNEDGEPMFYEVRNEEGKVVDELPIINDDAIDRCIARGDEHEELGKIMENWKAINHNMLDMLAFSGRISEKTAENLKKIEDYVPWQRVMDDEEGIFGGPTRKQTTGVTKFGKHRTEREIDNIIESMQEQVVKQTISSIRNFAQNRIAMQYGTRNDKGKLRLFPREGKSDEGVRIGIYANGRRVVIEIADSLVAQASIGLAQSPIQYDFQNILSGAANFLRRSITFSGYFQAKQVFKDAPAAALITGVKNPYKLWLGSFSAFGKALVDVGENDDIVKLMKSAGFGGFITHHRSAKKEVHKEIGAMTGQVFSKFLKVVDHIGDASDRAARMSTYNTVLGETGDKALALYMASDIMDFQKHGISKTAQLLRSTVTFMQAWATQLDLLGQAMIGGNLRGKTRAQAAAQFHFAMTQFAGLVVMYTLACLADPDYDDLDDDTKLHNIYIPFSKKVTGHHVLLPMNTSIAFFFKAIPEWITNYYVNQGTEKEIDKRRFKNALGRSAVDMLLGPEPIPTGIKAPVEVAFNHDFHTGSKVIPDYLKKLDVTRQYTKNTSELGKKMSKIMGGLISPMSADHLIRGLAGTVGEATMFMSNELNKDNRVAPQAKQNPLIGGFLGADVPRKEENLFYDIKEAADVAKNTHTSLNKSGRTAEAKQWFEDNKPLIVAQGYTQMLDAKLKQINAEMRRLADQPSDLEKVDAEIKRVTMTRTMDQQEKDEALQVLGDDRKAIIANIKNPMTPEQKLAKQNYYSELKNDILKNTVKWRIKTFHEMEQIEEAKKKAKQ